MMSSPVAISLLGFLVIFAGIYAWSFRMYARLNHDAAPLLEARQMRWDPKGSASVLEGVWNGVPVRITSCYLKPTRLTVTLRLATGPPDLDAHANRSNRIEFRSIRTNRFTFRVLARAFQEELGTPGPPMRMAMAEYFTPARVDHLRVLLVELEWERFSRSEDGISVSRSAAALVRRKSDQVHDLMHRTLVELQRVGV